MNKEEFDRLEKSFKVSDQYKFFLYLVGLSEDKMGESERKQRKLTFYSGFAQCLILLREHIPDLPEEEGIKTLESMLSEVGELVNQAAAEFEMKNPNQ